MSNKIPAPLDDRNIDTDTLLTCIFGEDYVERCPENHRHIITGFIEDNVYVATYMYNDTIMYLYPSTQQTEQDISNLENLLGDSVDIEARIKYYPATLLYKEHYEISFYRADED